MHWVFGVLVGFVVLGLLIYGNIRFPKRGWVLVLITVALLALASFLYWSDDSRQEHRLAIIQPEQVELSKLSLTPSHGAFYRFAGQLSNQSDYYLKAVIIQLDLLSCVSKPPVVTEAAASEGEPVCQVVQSREHRFEPHVEAQTTQSFETFVSFSGPAQPLNRYEWKVKILHAISRQ